MPVLDLLVVGITSGASLLFSIVVISMLADKYESSKLTSFVAILGLTLCTIFVSLIPIDIYNVSSAIDPDTGARTDFYDEAIERADVIKTIYNISFIVILCYIFFLVPFAYFWFEEDDFDISNKTRFFATLKYTVFSILAFVFLFILGALFQSSDSDSTVDWLKKLLDGHSSFDSAVLFASTVCACIGACFFACYSSYGLASLPIALISTLCKKENKEDMLMRQDLEAELALASDKRRVLLSTKAPSRKVRAVEKRQESLREQLSLTRRKVKESSKVLRIMSPFFGLLGLGAVTVSLVVVVSYCTTVVDQVSNHDELSRYVVSAPRVVNPLDAILNWGVPYFPLNVLFLAVIVVYLVISTIFSVCRLGIRILCVKLYRVRIKRTTPQGLLLLVVVVLSSSLCISLYSTSLAPSYVSFGTQVYKNETSGELIPCSLSVLNTTDCLLSQIGVINGVSTVAFPLFSSVYFYCSIVFIALFVITLLWVILRRSCCGYSDDDADSDDEEFIA
ncbi:hypothetical protein P9112_008853 [Eukaryota sp. TZLM1-RC]